MRCARVFNHAFFAATFAWQADFLFIDDVLEIGNLLNIGDQTTNFFQFTTATVRTWTCKQARLAGDRNPESQ